MSMLQRFCFNEQRRGVVCVCARARARVCVCFSGASTSMAPSVPRRTRPGPPRGRPPTRAPGSHSARAVAPSPGPTAAAFRREPSRCHRRATAAPCAISTGATQSRPGSCTGASTPSARTSSRPSRSFEPHVLGVIAEAAEPAPGLPVQLVIDLCSCNDTWMCECNQNLFACRRTVAPLYIGSGGWLSR
eukprot:COSAG06_NODE_455_length_15521_cov_8.312022_3_plen_189_part_00